MTQLLVPNPALAGKLTVVGNSQPHASKAKRERGVVSRKIRREQRRQARAAASRRRPQNHTCEPEERKGDGHTRHAYQYCRHCGRAMSGHPAQNPTRTAQASAEQNAAPNVTLQQVLSDARELDAELGKVAQDVAGRLAVQVDREIMALAAIAAPACPLRASA